MAPIAGTLVTSPRLVAGLFPLSLSFFLFLSFSASVFVTLVSFLLCLVTQGERKESCLGEDYADWETMATARESHAPPTPKAAAPGWLFHRTGLPFVPLPNVMCDFSLFPPCASRVLSCALCLA
jgi:hypothetical protein